MICRLSDIGGKVNLYMKLSSYIGGQFEASVGDIQTSVNPSQPSDIVAEFGVGSQEQASKAADAAAEALPKWRSATGVARAEFLTRWASVIADRSAMLADATAREVGKPISEARGEVGRCVALLRYYAGEAVREIGEVIPAQTAGSLQFSMRQPVGVCALITPWNFPLAIPIWKAAPALAFGNTVVLKPAEAASSIGHLLAETAQEAGVPAGVFNVLLGTGQGAGEPLLYHPDVRAMSFTGSQKVGQHLAGIAASTNVKFQGEMGGKNAAIVLADADLELAAQLIAAGAFRYAGQKCTATSRLIVIRTVADSVVAKIEDHMRGFMLEPVTDPRCAIGPLISGASRDRVVAALGAKAPALPDSEGFFMPPTIVRGVSAMDALAQEELFAPVLTVIEVDTLEEALLAANATPFGLSAALFTKDIGSALKYVDRIDAGMVRVNGDTTGVDPHAPFGGMKGSSTHSREQGGAAREFYTDVKTVQVNP